MEFNVDCEYNGNIGAANGRKYVNLLMTLARELGLIDRRVILILLCINAGRMAERTTCLLLMVKDGQKYSDE